MRHIPNEVLDLILGQLCRICRKEKRKQAAYATVNSRWQEFFEAKHFRTLSLTWQDFPELKNYVVGMRRKMLKGIRIKIIFGRSCRWERTAEIYQYMITTLLETLSTPEWSDIYNSRSPGPMVLRISMRRLDYISCRHLPQRLLYAPQLYLSRSSPVYAIKHLVLDPNVYDVFKANQKRLHYLLRSLPALGILTCENRLNISTIDRNTEPSGVYERMFQSLPATVAELELFEGTNGASYSHNHFPSSRANTGSVDEPSLALCLARVSRQLRNLSVSFVVDACHFFQPFMPRPSTARRINTNEWVWDELETLALTSQLFRLPHHRVEEVNELLEAISKAVRRMPKLLTLEIWNGNDDDHACLFRYGYNPKFRTASLTLKSTREINITRNTERSWAETVRQKTGLKSEIRFERLHITPPFMAEAVACLLELRDRVATQKALAFESSQRHLSAASGQLM